VSSGPLCPMRGTTSELLALSRASAPPSARARSVIGVALLHLPVCDRLAGNKFTRQQFQLEWPVFWACSERRAQFGDTSSSVLRF